VGDVCLFLASPLARYVTGSSIAVHGGGERPVYRDAAKNATAPPRPSGQ
jgi:enoyl-[acyl-carrier-protein] reductase (NADH)